MPAHLDQHFFFSSFSFLKKGEGEKKERKFEAEPGHQLYVSGGSHWLYYQQIMMVSKIEGK